MERLGYTVPLLIGGATTSRAHTAVKIAPNYSGPVIHVLDASRAAGVVSSLLREDLRSGFAAKNAEEQNKLRIEFQQKTSSKPLLPIETARERKEPIDWSAARIDRPGLVGANSMAGQPLDELVPYIDWSPFFHTWELRGRFPAILDDPEVGPQARQLFEDAQKLLQDIVNSRLITAKGVYGFWPANSVGDDIQVYGEELRTEVLAVFHMLRQQMDKPAGQFNYCLADFIAPKSSGRTDYLGGFAVTAGHGVDELARQFEADHDDYNAIMTKALADRLAEAFAEYLHERARREWGFGRVARCFGQRALFRSSKRQVLWSGKDWSRSGPRLSNPQRVAFGRSRALAGSLSELSTVERAYVPVTASTQTFKELLDPF
jgi:5-methyltetrahydrofolate--homocysteine methyltransferase